MTVPLTGLGRRLCDAKAKAERAMLILRVDDLNGVEEVLQAAGVRIATRQEIQNI